MKSNNEQLKNRGYAEETDLDDKISNEDAVTMLDSSAPSERTLAVRIIGRRKMSGYIDRLCGLLEKEKALYTKIELQKTLAEFGAAAVPCLVVLLGSIGSNQHTAPNNEDSGKTSYPLCRDIAARTLCMIGVEALPALKEVLQSGTRKQKLEALDAVGHISYNSGNVDCQDAVISMLAADDCDSLMKWKIIRALQGFSSERSENLLKEILADETDAVMIAEITTSISRMKKRG